MNCNIARLWKHDGGAIAVEFAMVMPLLSLVLLGITDFGNYMHDKMPLDALARQAVQYVVQGGNPSNISSDIIQTSDIYNQMKSSTPPINYSGTLTCYCASGASVNCNTGSCPAGDYVRSFYSVQVNATYSTILPWTGFPNTIAMQGSARMQYDR